MEAETDSHYRAMEEPAPPKKTCKERITNLKPRDYLKIAFVLFLIAFFALAIIESDTTEKIFTGFLNWMQDNLFVGALAYILIYTVTTVLVIPGSILTLGAGFVFNAVLGTWGVFLATLVVMIGATSGATLSFILAKTLLRDSVESLKSKYPTFSTIDAVVQIYGFRVTFLLRLSPAIPFNAFNYLMGLTSVRLIDYVGACLGMLPGTLAYCFIGASLGALAEASSVGFSDPTVLIFLIVGTSVTIVGMIVLSIYAKKKYIELKEKVEIKDSNNENNENNENDDNKNKGSNEDGQTQTHEYNDTTLIHGTNDSQPQLTKVDTNPMDQV